MIIYDIEIVKAIGDKWTVRSADIEYCDGWHDHANMGVSVIGVYDYTQERYRVFCEDNFDAFKELVTEADKIIGFNNIAFDNMVLNNNGFEMPEDKSYDILQEIWVGAGLSRTFNYPSHIGYGLDAVVRANALSAGKTGHGAQAPIQWQQGKIGAVIDYCLADVWNTKLLFDLIIENGQIVCPKTKQLISVARP